MRFTIISVNVIRGQSRQSNGPGLDYAAAFFRAASSRKFTRLRLTSSAWVQLMPCGPHSPRTASLPSQIPVSVFRWREEADPVGIAVNHQRRDVDSFEIVSEVGRRKCSNAIERPFGRSFRGDDPAEVDRLIAHLLPFQEIDVVEIGEKFGEKRRPVCNDRFFIPSKTLPSIPSGLSVVMSI